MSPQYELRLHHADLAVCQLEPGASPPPWATGAFVSITTTGGELSVVCDASAVPVGVVREAPWRLFEVVGPLAFSMVGVLAELSAALAESGVSVFVVSTYDTDWILVPAPAVGKARWALEARGHTVSPA